MVTQQTKPTRSVHRMVWGILAALVAYVAIAPMLYAVEVTPAQAVTAAQNWVRSNPRRLGSRFATERAVEMETVSNVTGRTMFHAMNLAGGGFVITSGDTRLSPIIAFSTTSSYSGDRTGPMYALLQRGMRRRMAALESQDRLVAAAAPGGAGRGAVEPDLTQDQVEAMSEWETLLSSKGGDRLYADGGVGSRTSVDDVRVPMLLKTQWAQSSLVVDNVVYPTFNYYIYNNSNLGGSVSKKFPCGCVATAGAQMMYYWKAPSSFGSYSEKCRWKASSADDWTTVTLTSISGTPAWSSMFEKNPFDDGYDVPSEAARKAVGMLTYNAAVAVGMDWKPNSGAASLLDMTEQMKSLFGYKSGTWVWYDIDADNYSGKYVPEDYAARLADFNNALFASLDAKMPVFMSISGESYENYDSEVSEGSLGHAIIADGYGYVSGKRYTHLNFGWLGSDDAWYRITDEMIDFEYDYGSHGYGWDRYFEFDGLGFNIHPTTSGDVISGRVLSSSSSPVSGATVTLYNSAGSVVKTASTDSKGIYSLRVTSAGNYTVKATSGSESSAAKAVSISYLSASGSYGYDIGYGGGLSGNRWGNDLKLGTYTLTCNPNGGKLNGNNFGTDNGKAVSHNVTVTYGGAAYSSLGTATRDGYTFKGWYTATSGGTQVFNSSGKCVTGTSYWNSSGQWAYKGNLTIYAQWTQNSASVSNVGFNPNGGTLSGGNFGSKNGTAQTATLTLTYGKGSYNSGMRATKSGATFNGFWTAASGGSQIYDANGKYVPNSLCWTSSGTWKHTGNAMLYARWASSDSHTVKFDPNGGVLSGGNFGSKNGTSQIASLQVTCGAGAYNAGMRATKGGATFNGWWTATSGGSMQYDANGKFVPNSTCWDANGKWKHHGNATLYARWVAPEYNVTFYPNGGVFEGSNFGTADGTTGPATVKTSLGRSAYNSGMRATRTGNYMFMGWWTATSGGSQIYDASGRYKPNSRCWTSDGKWQHAGNAALYARWLKVTFPSVGVWRRLSDGSWQSGPIVGNKIATISTTVKGAGTISFHWKVSCEGNGNAEWDWLEWVIDGEVQEKIDGKPSGWAAVSKNITGTGTHTIQWRYRKDESMNEGDDCGWIRNVYWSGSVE